MELGKKLSCFYSIQAVVSFAQAQDFVVVTKLPASKDV